MVMKKKRKQMRASNSMYYSRASISDSRLLKTLAEHSDHYSSNKKSPAYYTSFPPLENYENCHCASQEKQVTYKTENEKTKKRQLRNILSMPHRQKNVLNLIGFIFIFVGCLYQCFSFLGLYLQYPTTVEFNVANEVRLEFPAVTVCNSNPIRYKLWCKEDMSACIRKSNESLPDLSKRQAILYDSLTREDRIRLGIRFEDFVIYAEYEEEDVTQQFSWYYDYEFTNCYTFNARWGDTNEPVKTSVLYNPVTGKSSELILCVNTDVDNYSNLSGSVVGKLQMSIHSNNIVPNPTYDAASLEAGEFYSYGFQKVSTELLKSPYQTKCRSYKEEKERRTGARMSQKNCLLECFKTETEKLCGCTYRRLALMYDGTPCQYDSQIYCLGVIEDDVFNMCNPQCPMACSKVQFDNVATDAEPLRQVINESSLYERMQVRKIFKSHEEMSKNMACMRLHYGSTETRTLAHRPKYEFIEVFSLLGGYSGLWLGFSLLNGYEFILSCIKKYRMKRKISNTEHKVERIRKQRKYF